MLLLLEILGEDSEIEISNLKVKNKMRDLHSIDKSVSEDSVMYPEPFTEKDDEKKLKENHERQVESERLEYERRERKTRKRRKCKNR